MGHSNCDLFWPTDHVKFKEEIGEVFLNLSFVANQLEVLRLQLTDLKKKIF